MLEFFILFALVGIFVKLDHAVDILIALNGKIPADE